MTFDEREAAIALLAADPSAGDMISGGGGVRKLRVPKSGKGKSGGYRVLTYYMHENEPVFLLWVIVKSQQANLSDAQKAQLRQLAKEIRGER